MIGPIPLDPDEGPTAWVRVDRDGMIHLLNGTDPDDPTDTVSLNRRELDRVDEAVARAERAEYP